MPGIHRVLCLPDETIVFINAAFLESCGEDSPPGRLCDERVMRTSFMKICHHELRRGSEVDLTLKYVKNLNSLKPSAREIYSHLPSSPT
jgi:hypothetical protein